MSRRLATIAASLCLVAAACSSDPLVSDASTTTVANATTTVTTPVTTQPPDPEPLIATFTGVTADTISIAVVSVDYDQLRELFGVDLNYQDPEPVLSALVDELNERGGINGRQVEVVYRRFLPVGATEADRICLEITEDIGVFAVFGGFIGPGAQEVNLCLTQLHDTILIGLSGTDEQYARATAPWFVSEMEPIRQIEALVGLLDDEDALAEHVAIWVSNSELFPLVDDVRSELEAAGAKVVFSGLQSAPAWDLMASDREYSLILNRAIAEDVDAVFWLGNGLSPPKLHAKSAPAIAIYSPFADHIVAAMRDLPGVDELTVYGLGIFPKPYKEDALLARCIEIVEDRTDIVVRRAEEITLDEPDWYEAVVTNCQQLEMFRLAATAAGANLTNATFLEAAESIGRFDLPGEIAASISPGKYDLADALGLVIFDADAHDKGDFVPVGPVLVFD